MKCIKRPPKLSQQNICSHVFHFLPRCQRISFIFMSRKYEISLCQCIFEFDKNDFACKGHIIILHITLDKTARDYLDFLFLKLPFIHFHGSRTSLQSRGAVINYHENCRFMSYRAINQFLIGGGGGQSSFIRVKFCALYLTSFSNTILKVKVLATVSQKCY